MLKQEGGRRRKTRKSNSWAKAAGEYYRAHKNEVNSFSDVLKSRDFRAFYNKKYKGKKRGGKICEDGVTNDDGQPCPEDVKKNEEDAAANTAVETVDYFAQAKTAIGMTDEANEVKTPGGKRRSRKSAKKSRKSSKKSRKSSKKRFFGMM